MGIGNGTLIGQGNLFDIIGSDSSGQQAKPAPRNVAAAAAPAIQDFRLDGERGLASAWRQRAADNIAAIELCAAITARDGIATEAERAQLIRFSGFGASALANGMFRDTGKGTFRKGWEDLGTRLEAACDKPTLKGLMKATQYAHYTPEAIARAMWSAVETLGFSGGDILEPGCGSGIFLATAPRHLAAKSRFTGIDDDPAAIAVCRLLYPASRFIQEDFRLAATNRPCDLAIGNPPYSEVKVDNRTAIGRLGLSLHDHFIVRATRGLRPGGLAVFLTSRWTLDKADQTARRLLAEDLDLVAAVRLPNGCMASAGTDVLADVLLFRKRRDGEPSGDQCWLSTATVALPAANGEAEVLINDWFAGRPRAVLGRHERISSQWGPTYGVTGDTGGDIGRMLSAQLAAAIGVYKNARPTADMKSGNLLSGLGISSATPRANKQRHRAKDGPTQTATATTGPVLLTDMVRRPAAAHWRDGSFVLHRGQVMRVEGDLAVPIEKRSRSNTKGMPSTHEHIIRWLIPVRDALREVLELQVADLPWATAQEALQKAYSDFVRMTGAPINDTRIVESLDPATGQMRERERRPVLEAFRSDPDAWLTFSIENHDPQSNKATRGPVFEKRVIGGKAESVVIGDAIDALPITLRDRGRLDLAHLAAACGLTETEAAAQLGDRAYIDPEDMTWTTADEYLSGPVRHKLAMAEAAAKQDPRFERNVEALRGVQPRALTPSEISIDLGAAWIPTDVIEDFSAEVIGVRAKVTHASVIGAWSVDQRPYHQHAPSATTWGTHRLHAGDLLDDCLNSRTPTVKDKETDAEGREREVINQAETEAARAKEQQLRRAFQEWVWKANERALRLVDIYNSKYNDLAPRMFDGSHLTLDDSNLAIRFHGNQKRGIWRIVAAGDTYLAHWMGSGKTYILIGAIMEQKRLGLVRKPLLVVPNHVLEQFAVAFLNLYPRARILVANEDDMSRRNRQQFLGKATTQEWDCVIVSHSAFGFIPVSAACEAEVLEELRDSYIAVLTAEADDSSITRKRLERAKERISQRIEQLRGRKDTMVTIAEMGIDQILVDEAQDFRKLSFATNRKNIKGIDPDGSQRAWDLYVKSHHMRKINPGRGLVLASGTPITNTMGELFTIQRYMDPKALEMRGLQTFDAWAATFGRMRTELELQPNGRYKRVERFAEFVNIPELYAMFAQFADVVTEDELRRYVQLPRLRTGSRQIMTCEPTDGFKRGQARLAEDIVAIERRTGLPKAGEKIILTVIGDGRLLAIDPRTLDESEPNDQATKLNVLIDNVYETWKSTRDRVYMDPATDEQMPLRGASQMIFSDIAITPSERRGSFSAYEWIRSRLIERGVPRSDIVVMQEHKKLSARRAVFEGMNHGRIAITIGSSGTMGTGANGHVRLIALHHLDQPYLVSAVSQREARMIRQGNQNEEVDLVAYVTAGSMDATMWQLLKRKAGFINNFLCGDTTVRRMEEEDEQVAGFAYARAMASGDQRLERKAGLESDIGRLERLRRAHYDGQHAARVELRHARSELEHASAMLAGEQADIAQRVDTTADAFRMTVGKIEHLSRKDANDAIRDAISSANKRRTVGDWTIGTIGGFNIVAHGSWQHVLQGERMAQAHRVEICVQRNAYKHDVKLGDGNPVARLENVLRSIGDKVPHYERQIGLLQRRIADYEASQGAPYEFEAELARLQAENDALEAELAADGHDAPAGATIEDEASETTAETAHATDAFEDRDKNEPAASQAIAERIPPTAQRAALNA